MLLNQQVVGGIDEWHDQGLEKAGQWLAIVAVRSFLVLLFIVALF